MLNHSELIILTLVLTQGQGHTGKIFGGHESAPHSRPYMVLLERVMANGGTHYCGGFLLNEEFVMTAAHCDASHYHVLLGLHDFDKRENAQNISSDKAFPNKDYDAAEYRNDLMLIKLSSKVTFSSSVTPITLADQDDPAPVSCIISGWGRHDQTGYMSHVLREVNVTVTSSESCDEQNSFCTEGENRPGKGDSGGPLVCENGKAYGVVSACYTSKNVCYFTKISDYRDWIDCTMKYSSSKTI